MVRACGFSVGLFFALWGYTFLYIDRLVIHPGEVKEGRPEGLRGMLKQQQIEQKRLPVIDPPEWVPFLLLSIGSVTMLYSVALPKKSGS